MTFLGGIGGLGDGGGVVLLLVVDISAVDHELHCVLVDFPGCSEGECLVGHLGGNLCIPSRESVAFLLRIFWLGDSGIVFHFALCLHAINIKGQLVLVDFEDGGVGHIGCRHLGSDLGCPSLEGMSFLGGICRLGDSGLVVLLLVVDISAVGHELHRILIDFPGGGVGNGVGRHVGGHCRIPSIEGVAFLGGVLGLGDGGVVLQFTLGLVAVNVEGYLVFINLVESGDGDVTGGHGLREVVPLVETVAGLVSWRGCFHGCSEGDVLVLALAFAIEGCSIDMCLEGGCQRDALGRGEGVGSIGGYLCVAILPCHEVIAGDGSGSDGHWRAGHGFSISSGDGTHGSVGSS